MIRICQYRRFTGQPFDPLKNCERNRPTWGETWLLRREEMPIQAWLFLGGFLLPFLWWCGAITSVQRILDEESLCTDEAEILSEKNEEVVFERKKMWKYRCLFASLVSAAIYILMISYGIILSQ